MNYNLSFECVNSFGIYRTQATIEPLAQLLNITIDNTTSPMAGFCNSTGGTENLADNPMLLNATALPVYNKTIMSLLSKFPAEEMPAASGSGWMIPAREGQEQSAVCMRDRVFQSRSAAA